MVGALGACGGSGKASLRFLEKRASGQPLLSAEATVSASVFKMKLLQVYLLGKADVEGTQRLWINPACGEDTNQNCDVVAENDYGPVVKRVTDYFDFSPGKDVNSALNSQARSVATGTYTGVAMEFCTTLEPDTKNILFGGTQDGATFQHEYGEASCVVNSDPIEPAITLKAGETIVVSLEYSLEKSLRGTPGKTASQHPEQKSCVEAGDNTWCFRLPNFHPSISKPSTP